MRASALFAILVVGVGCSRWSSVPVGHGAPAPCPRVQIWSGDSVRLAEQAVVLGDTLQARLISPGGVARETVRIPIAGIDSRPVMGRHGFSGPDAGLVAGLVVAIGYVILIHAGRGN